MNGWYWLLGPISNIILNKIQKHTVIFYLHNSPHVYLSIVPDWLWLPNTELSVVSFLSSLCWSWHSEVSKMVWHLKIGAGVQKLEIFKELWKQVKILFWNLVKMVSRKRAKMLKMLDFLKILFCSAILALLALYI